MTGPPRPPSPSSGSSNDGPTQLTGAALLGSLATRREVAAALEVPWHQLAWLLFRTGRDGHYRSWTIKKKWGGVREIRSPRLALLRVQQRLRAILDDVYEPPASAHGFIYARSVRTNALPHVSSNLVLNLDLVDFFPSINFGRVRGLFLAGPFNCTSEAATVLAQICCSDGQLPIGAPTSPVISNMICRRLDRELRVLAQQHGCRYTRYADDITFSTRRGLFPPAVALRDAEGSVELGTPLADIIEGNGFDARHTKTRLQGKSDRQLVTGVIVNERLNVDRRYIRRVRAMLHNWEHQGLELVQHELESHHDSKDRHPNAQPDFRDVLRGRIAYLAMIRGSSDPIAVRFATQFANLAEGRDLNAGVQSPSPSVAAASASERRQLLSVMFTDIVDSTTRAAGVGDRRWHQILEAHNRRVRSSIGRYGGREVKTIGDAFLATFESPTGAILCGLAIHQSMQSLKIEVKIGIHTGEVIVGRDDVEGLGVVVASRIVDLAAPGEVLVSSTVKELVTGGEFFFADRETHDLKGLGPWHLFRALRSEGDAQTT
ncbi:MAG: adenylate/guanylate cyclase domain-containing protein [Acidimicrobiia bacterium]